MNRDPASGTSRPSRGEHPDSALGPNPPPNLVEDSPRDRWAEYLDRFHRSHSGITEQVLGRSLSRGASPYHWVRDAVPPGTRVLDLACGSAPLSPLFPPGEWVGLDCSWSELDVAASRAREPLVMGRAEQLPFADHSFDSIVCTMALMLIEPLDACWDQIGRVVAPGGTVIALLPGGAGPLDTRDRWRWMRLLSQLGRWRLSYPSERVVGGTFRRTRVDWRVASDDRWRFSFSIEEARDADLLVESLYLPGTTPERVRRAQRLARRWVGSDVGIPLRRVVLVHDGRD